MSKSIKLKDDNYWDSRSIIHNISGAYSKVSLKEFLPAGSTKSPFYTTHYMKLGYISCALEGSSDWSNLTLLFSSTFYEAQHWSTHLLTLAQAKNIEANYIKIGGNNRNFFYKKDDTNKRIYIYAYVDGGNGFGNWIITLLSQWQCRWVTEIEFNVTKEDSWVEISAVS